MSPPARAPRREPVVSIVLPVRGPGPWLRECLDSIAAQTLVDYELLVVDDGCADGALGEVAALARGDSRVRVLPSPGHGLVAALNHGIVAARGTLVARMDVDDRMHPLRLQRQATVLARRPELTLLGCRVDAFPDAALGRGMREYLRWQNACVSPQQVWTQLYVESPFVHPSVMFRRDAVLSIGGYHEGDFPEDYELWLRLAHGGHGMAKVDDVLLEWRQHGGSHSRTDPRYAREAFDALRARYLCRDPRLDPDRTLAVWGAGRRTRRRVRLLQQAGRRVSAWIDIDPRKIGNRVQGLCVHAPEWLARQDRARRPFVLGYVANHGARDAITAALVQMGYRAGEDFLMVG